MDTTRRIIERVEAELGVDVQYVADQERRFPGAEIVLAIVLGLTGVYMDGFLGLRERAVKHREWLRGLRGSREAPQDELSRLRGEIAELEPKVRAVDPAARADRAEIARSEGQAALEELGIPPSRAARVAGRISTELQLELWGASEGSQP